MRIGLAARWIAAFTMIHAAGATAMACGAIYRIDPAALTRTMSQSGKVKTTTWTLTDNWALGSGKAGEMLGGSTISISSDGRWSGRIGLRSDFRIRPTVYRLNAGFALHGPHRSGLVPTLRSGDLTVPKRASRWLEIGGKRGPEGVMYEIATKGNVKPAWTVSCAAGK